MAALEALQEARAAARRAAWGAARDRFGEVDPALLAPHDIEAMADAAWWTWRLDEAIALRQRAYTAWADAGEERHAARAAWFLSYDYLWKGSVSVASGWLRRAGRHLTAEAECVEHGYVALAHADDARRRGDLAEAARLAEEALELGRRTGARDLVAMALQTLGRALIAQGRPDEGTGMIDDAMCSVIAGELSPLFTGWIYCNVLGACLEAADLRRAGEWTAAALAWCDGQPERTPFDGLCRVYRIEVTILTGAWAEAEAEARLAGEELLNLWPDVAADAFYALGELERRRGRLVPAEAAFRRAHELGRDPQPGLALVRLAQSRVSDAVSMLRLPIASDPASVLTGSRVLAAQVEVALAAGDLARARAAVGALDELAERAGAGMIEATAAMARAHVLLAAGDSEQALREAGRAWILWRELRLPYETACARVALGQASRAMGDEDRARLELEAARAAFGRLGADLDARRAAGLLGPPPAGPGGLSAREVQVLRLVASGRTNRQIAAEMTLSEHTVSRHLQNIFGKLGVSTRAAATAAAFTDGLF